jgi:hypothetical protein
MAIADDWTVDESLKTIKHTSGTTVYTLNALYTWRMDAEDELAILSYDPSMSAQTPTDYSLINGFFIDDASLPYLSGGALKTIGWDAATYTNGIYVIAFGATYTNCVAGDIGKTVVSSSGSNGVLVNYDNTLKKWWVRRGTGTTWANTNTITITTGTGAGTLNAAGVTGESLFSNVYTLGTIETGTQLYVEQNSAVITTYWSTGHIDLVLKVKEASTLIDSGYIRVFAREYTDICDHFRIDLSSGGRNPVPLATSDDINNQTASGTVATWSDVTLTFGTASKNLNNGNGAKNYDVVVDCGGRTVAQVYERLKYVTRRGETATINSVQGQLYRSANGSYTEVKGSPFGTFAGGKFFGARGVWIENYNAADAKNFQLIAADASTQIPPNVVSAIISSVVSGDRCSMYRLTGAGGTINKTEYTLASGNNSGNGTLVMSGAISSDTPAAGVVRVVLSGNSEHRYTYTSWTSATFTLSGTLSQSYANTLTAYVPIIDAQASTTSASNTLTFGSAIEVRTRVRRKGILPFEVDGQITSAGLTVTAIRTTDSIVS